MTKEYYNFGVDTEARLYTETSEMTEKRFTIEPTMIRECIVDNTTGEQLDTFDYTERLCAKLNELAEENIELHIQNDFLKDENQHMRNLVNENKQLKDEVKEYKEAMKRMMIDMMGGKND